MSRLREASRAEERPAFAALLKSWREMRRQSQLGEALDIPLRDRNALLAASGFTPQYRESGLEGEQMAAVREALQLLIAHRGSACARRGRATSSR